MTAVNAKFNKSGYCTTFAAAYTSMPNMDKVDTARQAVSILLVCIAGILACIA